MKSVKFIIIFLFLIQNIVQAQQANRMSLKQCIDYALLNQNNIKSLQLDEEITKARNAQVFASVYPTVGVSGGLNYFPIVGKQRIATDAFGFTTDTINKYTAIQFGLPFGFACTLTVQQILYNSSVLIGLQARQTLEDLSKLNTKRTVEQMNVDVSKAYYNCVIASKRIKSLEENINLITNMETTVKGLFKEGFAEKIDADKLTVQKNNLITEKQEIDNLIELSYQMLKFQMGMDLNETIILTDDIDAAIAKQDLNLLEEPQYDNRIEMQLLKTAKKLNEFDYTRYKKSTHPTVVAFGSLGAGTSTKTFSDLFKYTLLPNSMVGINASVGLFDGGARKYKMQEVRLNIKKNEVSMDMLKDGIDLEASNAKKTLNNYLKNLKTQEENIELAQRVYDLAQRKYKEGLGSNVEVLQTQTAFKDAQTNYLSALYDVAIAKIDLQKALGLMK